METTPPKPRHRWRRRLLVLGGTLVILGALAPTLAAPLLRKKVEAALGARVGGECVVGSLSLSWWGGLAMADLVLRGSDGEQHLSVGRASADIDLWAALGGAYQIELRAQAWSARLRRRADGSWSLADLATPEEGQPIEPPSSEELARVTALLELTEGTLELEDGGQLARLDVERAELRIDGLDRPAPLRLRGALTARGPVSLGTGTVELNGQVNPTDLSARVNLHCTGQDLEVGEFLEPGLALRGRLTYDGRVLEVGELTLDSRAVSGTLTGSVVGLDGDAPALRGVVGQLDYLPDAVAPLLEGALPGELRGSEREQVEVAFEGPLSSFELEDVLAGCTGRSTVGLGTFASFGVEASGAVDLDLGDGALSLDGELEAAGGALSLTANYGDSGARLELHLDGASATAELAPLLGELHPVFHGLDQLDGAGLEGVLAADLALSIDGPVSLSGLAQGFDLTRVRGEGALSIGDARLSGSPFLAQLLAAFGQRAETPLYLAPMRFSFDGRRLTYAEPWGWRIGGVETLFRGGVALDGDLDLTWEVPVTAALAAKHPVLSGLEGKRLTVPLGGSLAAPELDWRTAFAGLAQHALQDVLREELDLEGLLGGDDATALLREADALWSTGDRPAARKLYQALRDRHRFTTVYLLHKKRIDERRRSQR